MPISGANLAPEQRFFGLFVGPSGGGKTPSACSFMDSTSDKEVLVLDFDDRVRGILGTPWVDKSRVKIERFPSKFKDTDPAVHIKVGEVLELVLAQINSRQNPYSTIVLDSLTSQTAGFIMDSLALTHIGNKGMNMGKIKIPGIEEYKFESTGTHQLIAFLKTLPIQNVIVSAHITDRYGKDPSQPVNDKMDMRPSVVVGEGLSIRPKLAAELPGLFDHVFRFERKVINNQNRVFVQFWTDLARTVYPNLPVGEIDITGQSFYKVLMGLVNGTTKIVNGVPVANSSAVVGK